MHCASESKGGEGDDRTTRLARRIVAARLALPAIIGLEVLKPLSFLGSQLLLVAEPLLGRRTRSYARALEDPQAIDELLAELEAATTKPANGDADIR